LSLITKTTHGATHALSISPILVIDDNPFYEGLYNELSNHATQKARMQENKEQNQIPLNPLNLSPIGIDCRNG
jgi:hypothetical protein